MSRVELAGPSRTLQAPPEIAEAVVAALESLLSARGALPGPQSPTASRWRFAGRPWAAPAPTRRARPGRYRVR